jgi:hypothetical protein
MRRRLQRNHHQAILTERISPWSLDIFPERDSLGGYEIIGPMSTVLALTQFVLLTFGTIFLKGMVKANGDITSSTYFQFLDKNWLWFFLIPVASVFYIQMSYQINKLPFTPAVARITGIVLSGICLIYFASVMFFPSA